MSATEALTFVLCIENNAIRAQALLLCESIRQFGGCHRRAPIIAVAPRPGLGIDGEARVRLEALGVEYAEEPLNRVCPQYGSANRVFTAAWAEGRARSEWVVVLDSDTVFFEALELPVAADVAVRPIDSKGSATEGPGDPFDDYWTRLAAIQGVPLDGLPFVRTTDRRHRVRASYNGGLVVVRRERGILRAWADLFSRSVAAGLKPWRGSSLNVYASTGFVGPEASEYWGSNQAAAALAIWGTTNRVFHYPDTYNVPLHLLMEHPELASGPRTSPLVHVHYHWLFTSPYYERALATLQDLGAGRDRLDWLRARLPIH
ncbi:MAG: hypothetical protein GEU82_18655 [Luteitalea sp.]|nr:hypothetical protein [Luteitalea sp.]